MQTIENIQGTREKWLAIKLLINNEEYIEAANEMLAVCPLCIDTCSYCIVADHLRGTCFYQGPYALVHDNWSEDIQSEKELLVETVEWALTILDELEEKLRDDKEE